MELSTRFGTKEIEILPIFTYRPGYNSLREKRRWKLNIFTVVTNGLGIEKGYDRKTVTPCAIMPPEKARRMPENVKNEIARSHSTKKSGRVRFFGCGFRHDKIRNSHSTKKSGRVRIVVVVAVVAILVVSATAATQFYAAYRLPDPATADADGLIRWLVTVDLENHSPQTQSILAQRLEEEFGAMTDWSELASKVPEEYRQQLWNNFQLLLRPWFFDKMERYHAGTPQERIEIVDRLLDQIETWKGALELAPEGEYDTAAAGTYLAFFSQKIEQWKQTCSPEEAQRLDEFICIVQARWLMRQFMG